MSVSKKSIVAFLVPISVLLANFTNLLTQLMLPRYLANEEYSQLATLWSYGQLANVIVFEWMRFGVLRFSEGADADQAAIRRSVLYISYLLGVFLFLFLSTVSFLLFSDEKLQVWVLAVSVYAIGQGVFDGRQSLARARFENVRFATAWIFRSGLSLALALVIAIYFKSGVAVLFGLGGSFLISTVFFGGKSCFRIRGRVFNSAELEFLMKYGAFVAVSSSISAALPAVVRSLILNSADSSGAAGSILSLDLTQKALAVIGMAINVTILQKAIRVVEFGGGHQKSQQMTRHVALTVVVMLPAAISFYEVQPVVSKYLVPHDYISSYMGCVAISTFGALLLCLRQFAVDALFMVVGKSTLSIVGPIVAVVATLMCAWSLSGLAWAPELIMCVSMAVGLLAAMFAAVYAVSRIVSISWPVRDFGFSVLGCFFMSIAMRSLTNGSESPLLFMVAVGVGLLTYVIFAWLVNLCGFRSFMKQRLLKSA